VGSCLSELLLLLAVPVNRLLYLASVDWRFGVGLDAEPYLVALDAHHHDRDAARLGVAAADVDGLAEPSAEN